MVWNYNQVYMLHKDRTHCMSNHVRKYIWDQTNRNYHCCLKSLNFPRWKKNFQSCLIRKKMSSFCSIFLFRRSHQNKSMFRRNIRFRWNRAYSRIHKDNNRFLCRSRSGSIRRSRRGWKSTYRTDSSCYRYNNKYIRSRPYRLSRKTNKLRTYNSDIHSADNRYRKRNHKHNARNSF